MDKQLKVLSLFLASPSDLGAERTAAKEVVEELNQSVARPLNWRVELFGWEDSPIGFARPQSKINVEVDRCELFVGLLWRRWGQPPGDSPYQSGFEEEFERAKARREQERAPEIWLFLKDIPTEAAADPGEQLKLVLTFRERIEREKKLFYKSFRDTTEWTQEFRRRLSHHIVSLATQSPPSGGPSSSETPHDTSPARDAVDSPASNTGTAPPQSLEMLRKVASAIEAGALEDAYPRQLDDLTIARLSLLTATFSSARYDNELPLGVHQVHILYRNRENVALARSEWLAVVKTALASTTETVPSWFWISRTIKLAQFLRAVVEIEENPAVRAGALRTLRELKISMPPRAKTAVLRAVASSEKEHLIKEAIRWIEAAGTIGDSWFLQTIIDHSDQTLSKLAKAARRRLLFWGDPSSAFDEVLRGTVELDPDDDLLRASAAGISDDLLEKGITHEVAEVREFSAHELWKRGKLGIASATKLLSDATPKVREVAIRAVVALGQAIDLGTIKNAWPKPQTVLASLGTPANDAEDVYVEALKNRAFAELEDQPDWYGISSRLVYRALGLHFFPVFGDRIRADLKDDFDALKRRSDDQLAKRAGEQAAEKLKREYETKGLNSFIRGQFRKAALIALAKNGSMIDLDTIRNNLQTDDSDLAAPFAAFMRRFGDHSDARRLLLLANKAWRDPEILLAAALHLSENQRKLVMDETATPLSRATLVKLAPSDAFRRMEPDWMPLLNDQVSAVRKACVARIFDVTSTKYRRALIDRYTSQPIYYYDTVFWLDRLSYAPAAYQKAFRLQIDV